VTIGAPVDGALNSVHHLGGLTTNEVAVELRPGQFSVQCAVGGTVTIGNIPIEMDLPPPVATLPATV